MSILHSTDVITAQSRSQGINLHEGLLVVGNHMKQTEQKTLWSIWSVTKTYNKQARIIVHDTKQNRIFFWRDE